jgi:hypothetical protein
MEEYADAIRQQSLDLIEKNTRAEREIDSLSNRLTDITGEYTQITQRLSTAASRVEELQSTLNKNQYQHEQEVDRITAKADEIEQNLTEKGETISILRAEIKKKSERSDLVGEIKEVIQDIDKQIAEGRLSDIQIKQSSSADRTCRVLICTVDDQVLRFPMFTKRLTIGRSRDNDVQIRTESVSRRHAVIQTDGDVTRIIDWGSKNGIQVNSAIVSEHFLCHGDTIIIGNARLRYEERKKRNSP